MTFDGVEKINRVKCALPSSKLDIPKWMANIMQCYPLTPILSGKHNASSRFCQQHQDVVADGNDKFTLEKLKQHDQIPDD